MNSLQGRLKQYRATINVLDEDIPFQKDLKDIILHIVRIKKDRQKRLKSKKKR